jgi:hypothetical protein
MDPAQSRDAGGGQLHVRIGGHATRHIYRVRRFDPAADAACMTPEALGAGISSRAATPEHVGWTGFFCANVEPTLIRR